MTPLPAALLKGPNAKTFVAWRLERSDFAATWSGGFGAQKVGGRWSPRGRAVIYTSLDPATAILEVAVHKGFPALDAVPHQLLAIEALKPAKVHVVKASDVPNPRWLQPGSISAGQQAFGADLLDQHPFMLVPSVVSVHSWNLIIDVRSATGLFKLHASEDFGLDTRLNPL